MANFFASSRCLIVRRMPFFTPCVPLLSTPSSASLSCSSFSSFSPLIYRNFSASAQQSSTVQEAVVDEASSSSPTSSDSSANSSSPPPPPPPYPSTADWSVFDKYRTYSTPTDHLENAIPASHPFAYQPHGHKNRKRKTRAPDPKSTVLYRIAYHRYQVFRPFDGKAAFESKSNLSSKINQILGKTETDEDEFFKGNLPRKFDILQKVQSQLAVPIPSGDLGNIVSVKGLVEYYWERYVRTADYYAKLVGPPEEDYPKNLTIDIFPAAESHPSRTIT